MLEFLLPWFLAYSPKPSSLSPAVLRSHQSSTQSLFLSGLNRSRLVWNLTQKTCILLHFVPRCCRYGVGRKKATERCWKWLKVPERQATVPGYRAAQEGGVEQISLIFSFHEKGIFHSMAQKSCFLESFTLVPTTPANDWPHHSMPSTLILRYREILFIWGRLHSTKSELCHLKRQLCCPSLSKIVQRSLVP